MRIRPKRIFETHLSSLHDPVSISGSLACTYCSFSHRHSLLFSRREAAAGCASGCYGGASVAHSARLHVFSCSTRALSLVSSSTALELSNFSFQREPNVVPLIFQRVAYLFRKHNNNNKLSFTYAVYRAMKIKLTYFELDALHFPRRRRQRPSKRCRRLWSFCF